MEMLSNRFNSQGFMPHGHCFLWIPSILWTSVIADTLIALAYLTIPITLIYFIRRRRDMPSNWMFIAFGVLILACGSTHVAEIWVIWRPDYVPLVILKAITAVASVVTAIALVRLVPVALLIPSPAQLAWRSAPVGAPDEWRRESGEHVGAGQPLLVRRADASGRRARRRHRWPRNPQRYLGPRKTLPVVGDVATSRALLRDLLGALGFRMLEADNGAAALLLAKINLPDMVLMDMVMPDMDGIETTRRLRAEPRTAETPVLIISASPTPEEGQRAIAAGADAFLGKRVDEHALRGEIGARLKLQWIKWPSHRIASDNGAQ